MSMPESTMASVAANASASSPNSANEAAASVSPLQSALDFWRTFDLNARRANLDNQGIAIADRQEGSAASRKEIASNTRNFRKLVNDGAAPSAKDIGAILKAYQVEIDSLTNRAKAAETSFISLYKALYDAPDPVESLSQAARDSHNVFQLRDQVSSLKDERGGLVERTATTVALENRVHQLEAQLSAADQQAAEDARLMLEQKQTQWMASQQKAIEAYELREQELIHQLRIANGSIRRMQASSEEMKQQLNDTRSQLEHLKSTRASVNDMAVEDLERTRAEANSLRRRCVQLENRLAGRPDDSEADLSDVANAVGPSALSAELAARDVQISQLKDQVSALEEVLGGKDLEKRNEFAKLTTSITEKDASLTTMREKLNQLPSIEDYQNMKRQFETLQSFQLLDAENNASVEDGADGGVAGDDRAGSTSGRNVDTLEKRLLNKVKSLEGRLTKMRLDLGEREGKIDGLRNTVRTYEDQVSDQKALILKLEDGINAITGEKGGMQALKRRAAAASKADGDDIGKLGGADMLKEEEDGQSAWDWGDKYQAEGLENIIQKEPSMLDIVAGQRDRFRARTMELEEDNRKLMERIEKVMSEVDSLKSDNVRLYEKLRFVQSYRQSNVALASAGGASTSTAIDIGIAGGSDSVGGGGGGGDEEDVTGLLGKYRSMYEDMVNPYTIFNRRERHKRVSEMSAPERLTLRAGQKALSTRTSRLIVFFYIIALHILVALVLGFSNTVCESDSVTTKATHITR